MQQRCDFPVSDIPTPWLSRLVFKHLGEQSKQSLLRTCKTFRDFSLGQAEHVWCRMPTSRLSPENAAGSLRPLLVCSQDCQVTLVFEDEAYERLPAAQFTLWVRKLCSHASILPGLPLHRVKCVELQGFVEGDIVPVELIVACPNMTHLVRNGHFDIWRDCVPMACLQLQQLTLHHLTYQQSQGRIYDEPHIEVDAAQHQLRRLPNLERIVCTFIGGDQQQNDGVRCLVDNIQVLRHQLLRVHIEACFEVDLGRLLASPWPKLCVLRLPEQVMQEDDLELVFQQAPQLEKLEVGWLPDSTNAFQLRAFKLQVLSVAHASLPALAGLSSSGMQTLRIGELRFEEDDERHVEDAITQLASWRNVMPGRAGSTLALYSNVSEESFPIPALLPLLRLIPVKSIMFTYCKDLSKKWLKLLTAVECHILAMTPKALARGAWATLFVDLPKLHTLQLLFDDNHHCMPDDCVLSVQLCTLCMTAPRPVTIQVCQGLVEHLDEGWQALVDACGQASSWRDVTIEMIDDIPI